MDKSKPCDESKLLNTDICCNSEVYQLDASPSNTLLNQQTHFVYNYLFHANGEATGPERESDLFMLPMPQIIQPGVERAENFELQRSQMSCPMVERRLSVAAQN